MKDTQCLSVAYCIHTPQVSQIITKSQSPFKDLKKLSDYWCAWQECMSPSMSYLIKEFKIILSFHLILSSVMTPLGPPNSPALPLFHSPSSFFSHFPASYPAYSPWPVIIIRPLHTSLIQPFVIFSSLYLLSKTSALISPALYLLCTCIYAVESSWTKLN